MNMQRKDWSLFLLSCCLLVPLLLYLLLSITTVCNKVEVWCPNPKYTFTTKSCCSALWLSLGAAIGVGNECRIDLDDMRKSCPMYDCYTNSETRTWNTNGCTYVPKALLNENSCDIHDLCYITPGATKLECDEKFVENINLIYCTHVPLLEKVACSARASIAGIVVQGFDGFWAESEESRESCRLISSWSQTVQLLVILACLVLLILFLLTSNSSFYRRQYPKPK